MNSPVITVAIMALATTMTHMRKARAKPVVSCCGRTFRRSSAFGNVEVLPCKSVESLRVLLLSLKHWLILPAEETLQNPPITFSNHLEWPEDCIHGRYDNVH